MGWPSLYKLKLLWLYTLYVIIDYKYHFGYKYSGHMVRK